MASNNKKNKAINSYLLKGGKTDVKLKRTNFYIKKDRVNIKTIKEYEYE